MIEAWGFTPKTGIVWDKVLHNFGHYVSVRHEHLIIATRGSCTPDRPTPMLDLVVDDPAGASYYSEKPSVPAVDRRARNDGPYLELFGRRQVEQLDATFGNDAALWHRSEVTA